jgi:hypothetical protein
LIGNRAGDEVATSKTENRDDTNLIDILNDSLSLVHDWVSSRGLLSVDFENQHFINAFENALFRY